MSQQETVLTRLREAGKSGVTGNQFYAACLPRFAARILELRGKVLIQPIRAATNQTREAVSRPSTESSGSSPVFGSEGEARIEPELCPDCHYGQNGPVQDSRCPGCHAGTCHGHSEPCDSCDGTGLASSTGEVTVNRDDLESLLDTYDRPGNEVTARLRAALEDGEER